MKLYNATFDIGFMTKCLDLYIPHSAGCDEDKVTPRVCLCDSVEHCIQVIAPSNRKLQKGAYLMIHEVAISGNDSNLLYPHELKESKRVPDALENNEYWYLKSIRCETSEYVIEDFTYEFTLAWSCISVEQCKDIIERYTNVFKKYLYKDSERMYSDFARWACEHKEWEILDDVWGALTQLPWAQKTEVTNLKLREIEHYSFMDKLLIF